MKTCKFVLPSLLFLAACSGVAQPSASPTATLAATSSATAEPAPISYRLSEDGAIVHRGALPADIHTLDPQQGEDSRSINFIENLFMQLTAADAYSAEIFPEAAAHWEISADGRAYTFSLRGDIPWVWHNPVSGETIQVVDADGQPRFVSAYDFEYGIQRLCHPLKAGYYNTVIAPLIKGCAAVLFAEEPDDLTEADYAAIGVTALDANTLVIELEFPAAYFLSMTAMWPLSAVPSWVIEEHEQRWIEAGMIVTNGRYVLHEWIHGHRITAWRNPYLPKDLTGTGNIERVEMRIVPDEAARYALWEAGEIELSTIPDDYLETHLEKYPQETDRLPDLAVFYIEFNHSIPPFDDWRVRAAFSAAYDRERHIRELHQGQGLPMTHLTPPGIFGAPPIDEVGIGYNPEYARRQLAAAGYPDCAGFPQVTLYGFSGQPTLKWMEFAQANWMDVLGCDLEQIKIEVQDFSILNYSLSPLIVIYHMRPFGWGPDYPDAHNWLGEVLGCQNWYEHTNRPCTPMDDLIVQASLESDPTARQALYRQIEAGFFGPGGEFPIIPIFLRAPFAARHTWLARPPDLFGGQRWYDWVITP
ncbi:MAG: peptide ABC transporter substrate-binding protein [Anaerolineae bacterium]|nr:peptide ABC transporter substrate-binding protein [Anaerolineae bacterium]